MSNEVGLLPPQTLTEALEDLARHPAVGGWKKLAVYVEPKFEDDPAEAGKWLRRALDPEKRDVLHDKHTRRARRLGCQVGCHVFAHWDARDCGYKPPEPDNQKSRHVQILEEEQRLIARQLELRKEREELEAEEAAHNVRRINDQ